jgi:hypothetical protein
MMSRLNIASWGLLIGAIGQSGFYGSLFPRLPDWIMFPILALPWLTVFIISFCNQPPFGPRLFRYFLVFTMCWYGVVTLLAEALHFFIHPAPYGHFSITVARVLTYLGALSFIVFVRACRDLSIYEVKTNA